jgi:hypothetical protein
VGIFFCIFSEELSGIFVKSISEGSAADLCKKIQVNDRIVEVCNAFIYIVPKSFVLKCLLKNYHRLSFKFLYAVPADLA